jgi:hypothetical protein
VHSGTTGAFALRFEPTSSVNTLTWSFTIPTGNISTKTMTVACWVKIASATYYAGTHQNPRLYINYDNGTTAYAQASDTTAWQLLAVSFTPSTSYGQITVTVDGRTDAATTNERIFYVDDISTLFPAGYALNTQGLDLWANALPVTPPLATVMSAADVWTALDTISYGVNTMGDRLRAYAPATIATATRSELATELARMDATITSRLAAASYSAAPSAATIADAVLDEDVTGHTGWLTKLLSVVKFLGLK